MSASEGPLVVGVDSSTQSTKALVVDVATGRVVASGQAAHTVTSGAGRESDPEQWWTALGEGPTLVLPTAYRLPQDVRAAVGRVAPKIGALGGGPQREAAAGRPGGRVDVHLLRAVSQAGFESLTLAQAFGEREAPRHVRLGLVEIVDHQHGARGVHQPLIPHPLASPTGSAGASRGRARRARRG